MTFVPRFRHLVRATVALISIAGSAVVATPATPVAAGVPRPSVLLLGDSTMAATEWYDAMGATASVDVLRGRFDVDMDSESCRRLVAPSCTGFDRATNARYRPPTVIEEMRARRGRHFDALVIMAGYDDSNIAGAIDAVMAEANSMGIRHVVWLTFRTTTAYVLPGGTAASGLYERHNATLVTALGRHPTLVVEDWDAYTRDLCNAPRAGSGAPGQRGVVPSLPCWFWWDGIHMTAAGAVGLTTYIEDRLGHVLADELDPRCNSTDRDGDPATPGPVAPSVAAAGGLVGAEPLRVLDTRPGDLEDPAHSFMIGAGRRLRVALSGLAPPDATAVLANVTAVGACGAGFVTTYPCDAGVPPTSTVNVNRRTVVANASLTRLAADRSVCVYASVDTDLVIDVNGWITPTGAQFEPVSPVRLIDTRNDSAVGPVGRVPAGTIVSVPIAGVGQVPAAATGAWLGVVGVNPSGAGYLTVRPCGSNPQTSTLNMDSDAAGGTVVANAAVVALGAGAVCVSASVDTDIVVDLFGWFGSGATRRIAATSPERVVDTRSFATPTVNGTMSLPPSAAGDIVNVTVVAPAAAGYAAVHPCGAVPLVSNANLTPGLVRPALAVAATSSGCVTTSVGAQVVVDRMATLA